MRHFLVSTIVLAAFLAAACVDGTTQAGSRDVSPIEASGTTESDTKAWRSTPAISDRDLSAHVGFLADDELEGRFPGTEGIREAEEYIASELARAGLSPTFHEFTVYQHGFDSSRSTVSITVDEEQRDAEMNRSFVPFWFSGDGALEAPLVFAGYGITAPEHDYDDYAGLDVEGKIVLLFRHEPNEADPDSVFNGAEFSRHAYFSTKAETAYENGAAGLILVTDPLHHDTDDFVIMPSMSLSEENPRAGNRNRPAIGDEFLAVHISQDVGHWIAGRWGMALEELQSHLDHGGRPAELSLAEAQAAVAIARRRPAVEISARNIVAVRRSRGAESYIVIGAHHDHLGIGAGSEDRTYNGADDNASGVGAVLELAASLPALPGHNLAFVTFSAEEQGLFGSRVFVESGPIPSDAISAMINFDMIGRNPDRPVRLYLGRMPASMGTAVREAVGRSEIAIEFDTGRIRAASDHFPFYEAGIPVASFFTGVHEDYHAPSDSAEKLDYHRMEGIVKTAAEIVRAVAQPGPVTVASEAESTTVGETHGR